MLPVSALTLARRPWHPALTFALLVTTNLFATPLIKNEERKSTVGMPARIEQLVLPGPELEVKPLEDRQSPIVLRILASYPHGTAHRYDLEYYGLEAGTFDLKDYLHRKDGTVAADLPPIPVTIVPVLPPGQVKPNQLQIHDPPQVGGYRILMAAAIVVWVLGLGAILFLGRRKRTGPNADVGKPLTLADRLRPLVLRAVDGRLSQTELADLERTLLAYWRRRLGLDDHKPGKANQMLRSHDEAGPLIRQLEEWLHRPGTSSHVDVAGLLRPYQSLPADELERRRESGVAAS